MSLCTAGRGGHGVGSRAVLQLDGLHLCHGVEPDFRLPGRAEQEVRNLSHVADLSTDASKFSAHILAKHVL